MVADVGNKVTRLEGFPKYANSVEHFGRAVMYV
jgi:hypothetical protein